MDDATRNSALDLVMAIVAVAALVIGLTSMLLGKIMAWWDAWSVNRSQVVMSPAPTQTMPDQQTDRQTDHVSGADQWLDRLEVDRTRVTWVELMVYIGYSVGEIRTLLKGDNGAIGTEVEAAKKKLGIVDEPRQLRVRDEKGERLIPMEVP